MESEKQNFIFQSGINIIRKWKLSCSLKSVEDLDNWKASQVRNTTCAHRKTRNVHVVLLNPKLSYFFWRESKEKD
jgi:hypothetical protein